MKRKGAIQPMLIIGTILLIGVIVFGLFKFDVFEKDTAKDEKPPVSDVVEEDNKDDEKLVVIDPIEEDNNQGGYDIEVGKLAPDFTLLNLDGEEVSLSDFRDKIVFINFWATWCPWCDKEMPDLHRLSEENDDVVVLAVNVQEKNKVIEDYIEKGGYEFEVVLDVDGEVAMTYLASSLPTTYFIDKEGILLGGKRGMLTWAEMSGVVESIREHE